MNISKIREISDIYKENVALVIGGQPYYKDSKAYMMTEVRYEFTKKNIVFYENHINLDKAEVTWHERLSIPLETAEQDIRALNSSLEKVLNK